MEPQQSVASPCISVCALNENEICLGCGRSLHEIAEWSAADDTRRQMMLEQARQRLSQICSEQATSRS